MPQDNLTPWRARRQVNGLRQVASLRAKRATSQSSQSTNPPTTSHRAPPRRADGENARYNKRTSRTGGRKTTGTSQPQEQHARRHPHQKIATNAVPRVSRYGSPHAISGSFNSIFKVLFIFPSLYFFSIGLPIVFSFRRDLSPVFGLHSQTNLLLRKEALVTMGLYFLQILLREYHHLCQSEDLGRSRPSMYLPTVYSCNQSVYNYNSGKMVLPD